MSSATMDSLNFSEDEFNHLDMSEFTNYMDGSNFSEVPPLLFGEFVCPLEVGGQDPLGPFKAAFVPAAYTLVFLLGTAGNTLVLVVLERHRRARSSTETFLLHLAVADLLLGLTLPFAVAEGAAGWIFGLALCKLVSSMHKVNFYCSSLLLACIAVDRYLAVVHTIHAYRRRQHRFSVHATCGAIWLLCLLCALPELLVVEVSPVGVNGTLLCSFPAHLGLLGSDVRLASRFLYHVGGFFLPVAVMGWCYAAIVRSLCRAQRRPQRQKAIKVAIAVTVIFFLCWSPYHVVIFLDTLVKLEALSRSCRLDRQLGAAITVCEFLGLAHCCLNPLVYAFVGVKFRSDLLRLLADLGCVGPKRLRRLLPSGHRASSSESDNATSLTTF
ncbi:C-X-C chemokine receptor type 5 [Ornithorhynchus anatinus]|uniref:C-X-C chemokine receptor type 5 n=1 Tax=Ornithorhynchus anatinus TaxID=9258 RepID=A0A6I8NWV2_ORNAN|nr:C-X-C chemokine receptor type 5 [Ornithorhynchus anatinus]